MLRIALVHNERAGSKQHLASDLVRIFRGLGHETEAYGRDSAGLLRVLNSRADVVVVSGGDLPAPRGALAVPLGATVIAATLRAVFRFQ